MTDFDIDWDDLEAEFDNMKFDNNESPDGKHLGDKDYKFCEDCDILMDVDVNNTLTCSSCGMIKNITTENNEYEPSMNGYNTNNNFHIPIKCVGANSFQYQKQLRNSTSQYSIVQESNLRRKLERLNFRSRTIFIPKKIIENVIAQYKLIRETDKIHRGDIFNGIIGSLVYYECLNSGIARKHKEISDWYGITENDLSKGDKIVRILEEKKILKLPIYEDNDFKYIESYLKRTEIDIRYGDFMMELLEKIEDLKIGNHNARLSTKISAIIFLIVVGTKTGISSSFEKVPEYSAEELSKEFSISISTFKTFYGDINKNKKNLDDILCKYGLAMPDKLPRKRRKI
jgi:transcription initiation factor TFIIIB Brf1 subunit/transcription initiation factor TFIIB